MPGRYSITDGARRGQSCARRPACRPSGFHSQVLSIKNEARPRPCADFSGRPAGGPRQTGCPISRALCEKWGTRNLGVFFLPNIEPLHLRAIAAARHVAPAAVMVLAGIQKKPFAGFRRARTNVRQLIRCQQIGRRAGDGPEQAVEVSEFVESPLEPVLRWHQVHVPGRGLRGGIQPGESSRRRGTLVHDRPENIVNGFAQFSALIERTPRELGLEVAALEEPVRLRQ